MKVYNLGFLIVVISLMTTQAFSKSVNEKQKNQDQAKLLKLESVSPNIVKKITVNGMVCSFCASSLEKKFLKAPEVKKVDIKLEDKYVKVSFKPGYNLSDKKLTSMISKSGFKVKEIAVTQGKLKDPVALLEPKPSLKKKFPSKFPKGSETK